MGPLAARALCRGRRSASVGLGRPEGHGAPTADSAISETRVLFVAASLAVSGGAETQLVDLVTCLDRRFAPTLVCIKGGGELVERAIASGVDTISLGLDGRFNPRILMRLVGLMRRLRPSIVHCTEFNATAWGRVAAMLSGVPRIVTAEHSTYRTRWLVRVAVPLCNRLLGPRTDAVVACAHVQADVLVSERNPRERVRVIPNGVDPDLYTDADDPRLRHEWNIPASRVAVGIIGELRPVKNQEMLLRVAALLRDQGVDAHYVVVGDGPSRSSLEHTVTESRMDGLVTFLGWRRDVPRVLTGLHVVALSSLSEASPLCILEAMAAGRPVVATDVGDVSRIVVDGETGFVVPAQDDAAFADRVRRLVENEGLRAAMGAAGRRRVREGFTRVRMIREYERLFDEILARDAR